MVKSSIDVCGALFQWISILSFNIMDMRFIAAFSSSYIKGLFIFVWKKDYFIHENRKSRRPFLNIQRTYPSAKKKSCVRFVSHREVFSSVTITVPINWRRLASEWGLGIETKGEGSSFKEIVRSRCFRWCFQEEEEGEDTAGFPRESRVGSTAAHPRTRNIAHTHARIGLRCDNLVAYCMWKLSKLLNSCFTPAHWCSRHEPSRGKSRLGSQICRSLGFVSCTISPWRIWSEAAVRVK